MPDDAGTIAIPRADLVLLLDWWMSPYAWKRVSVAPAVERCSALLNDAPDCPARSGQEECA